MTMAPLRDRPSRGVWRHSAKQIATRTITFASVAAIALSAPAASAQKAKGPQLPIVRDAEIEQLLREYSAPILRAAGLTKQNIRPVILNDRTFNAFVIDGKRIFINAGALLDAKTPNEIIGVLAHESGHIAGGHLSKMREELANAQTAAIVAMLLGIGAAVAGSRTSQVGGNPGVVAMAGQGMIERSLLSYVRGQEEQADRAGVKFLTATGQSPKGMYDTFKRMSDQVLYAARNADPYLQSHPMPADRVAALEVLAKSSPYWDKKDSPELQLRHDLMKAKLHGFLDQPDAIARTYPSSDTSLPARYARAISAYRFGDPRAAAAQIEGLIAMQPNNPYFYELKGQALLESGRAADAIAPLRKAISLAPDPTLMQVMLAQAVINSRGSHIDEAIQSLNTALLRDPDIVDAYEQLALAYGHKGDIAQADLASAQAAFHRGDFKTARQLASRAKTEFPIGSPGWVKSDDILGFKAPAQAANKF
jgi:predicted Zn-dependent protease